MAGENTALIALPEAVVVIYRSDPAFPIAQLVLDTALQPLRDTAVNLNRNILAGIMWAVVGPTGPSSCEAAVLLRSDCAVRFVDWSTHYSGRVRGRIGVPTPAGDIDISVAVCADTQFVTTHDGIHLVVASCRPSRLRSFLDRFPLGIGVNKAGRNLEPS